MNTQQVVDQFNQFVIANYSRLPRVIVKAQGATMWDADGREYLDFFPGWAVSGIGHCHPRVVAAIQRQAAELIHIDNTFYSLPQGQLAQMLSERAFGGKLFFCNSGAEAVEAALKLARKATPENKYKIITALGGFHGRTFGAITATAQPKYHAGFAPMLPGFKYVPYNDLDAVRQAADDETAAVMVEPIQGEGGVRVPDDEYLRGLRQLCDERGMLLILDEVQTGLGRTGTWFGYQHANVVPDIMTLAKALGGGVSIGAIMARAEIGQAFVPGTHASTFGGNPLACAAGVAVIEAIEQENLLENAEVAGDRIMAHAEKLAGRHSCIQEIRGRGLMIGIELDRPGQGIVDACLERGLRVNCTQSVVLRMTPPMTVTPEQIDRAMAIIDDAMAAE